MSDCKPVWASRKTVFTLYHIPRRQLTRLVRQGYVRRLRFGETRQAATVYNMRDLDQALTALAAGYMPRRPRYRATRQATRREVRP